MFLQACFSRLRFVIGRILKRNELLTKRRRSDSKSVRRTVRRELEGALGKLIHRALFAKKRAMRDPQEGGGAWDFLDAAAPCGNLCINLRTPVENRRSSFIQSSMSAPSPSAPPCGESPAPEAPPAGPPPKIGAPARRRWFKWSVRVLWSVLCVGALGLFALALWDDLRSVPLVRAVPAAAWRGGTADDLPLPPPHSGVVAPPLAMAVHAPVVGMVRSVEVREGEPVVQGRILARLNAPSERIPLSGNAGKAVLRVGSSCSEPEERKATEEGDFFDVLSPCDGVVRSLLTASGRAAFPDGPPLLTITPSDGVTVSVAMTWGNALRAGLGRRVHVAFPEAEGTADGTVSGISGRLGENGNLFDVRVRLNSAAENMRPGMAACVDFLENEEEKERRQWMLIPHAALIAGDAGNGDAVFWVVGADNHLQKRRALLRPDCDAEGNCTILGGVVPGELVVLRPDASLREGQRVAAE